MTLDFMTLDFTTLGFQKIDLINRILNKKN